MVVNKDALFIDSIKYKSLIIFVMLIGRLPFNNPMSCYMYNSIMPKPQILIEIYISDHVVCKK